MDSVLGFSREIDLIAYFYSILYNRIYIIYNRIYATNIYIYIFKERERMRDLFEETGLGNCGGWQVRNLQGMSAGWKFRQKFMSQS